MKERPMRALVLGGHGFLGSSVVAALAASGHGVEIGSRQLQRTGFGCRVRRISLHEYLTPESWQRVLDGVDVVVNCVGILRERGRETYERVHHLAPAALASACARAGVRFVHVSALGLSPRARSRFITSKLHGETAIRASGADYTIVRPSLLDGEGGFGARWLRAMARLPVHCVPADAAGRIAVLHVDDAGIAIARLCELPGPDYREAELGGSDWRTLAQHLAILRGDAARVVRVPATVARVASHVCDIAHWSPFSFGHLELLRHDNVPRGDLLALLLGRAPRRVTAVRARASARDPAILPPMQAPDGGNTPTARAR
jgi:NADH dehydrogenase